MRAEQANKLCKPRRRMGVKVWFQKFGLSLQVIITDRPKTVISLRFYLFYVRCCSIFTCFKCFNFNTSMCLIYSIH